MISFPADFITASESIPPAEEWIIACLKMPSGDVWLSDRPVSAELLLPLPGTPLPCVENWGEANDGGTVENFLSPGNLECPQQTITVIRADQNKTEIDAIILQGIHNRKIELYRWFTGMTSDPVLIDILFCQDRIELKESSALWSFDVVGCLCSENPYITDRSNGNDTYPYVIGRAQGLPLQFLEEQSKWTTLLGDQDGKEIDESYTGLIRVQDATQLSAGDHLINGEQVTLVTASAGYMELATRAQGATEAQDHGSGSRIFPVGALFKYAVCAGPVGSLELLRTSNELDIYDEDEDLDTEEYRDLYSGGNEVLHPELNPAQIWFNDRMPWLKKDQDYELVDKEFYGKSFSQVDISSIKYPFDINKKDGKASILISFRKFSQPAADYWYKDTTIPLPSFAGEGNGASTYAASENLSDGSDYFSINQSFGEYITNMTSTAYREFRVNSNCPPNEEAWTMIEPEMPNTEEFVFTEEGNYWSIVFQRVVTAWMDIKIEIFEVDKSGAEFPLHSETRLGSLSGEQDWYPTGYAFSQQFIDYNAYTTNRRMKFKITCLNSTNPNAYAFVRIGGKSQYSETFHYGMAAFWQYYDSAPTASLTSKFSRNLSSRGTFISAKARIKGVLRNSEDKGEGTLKIYDGATEKSSSAVTEGDEVDITIDLDATTWAELSLSEVKLEVALDYALIYDFTTSTVSGIPRTDGHAGIELDDGVQWLISYTGTNLDGIQVNYADQLYVDAVSIHGENETPAQAIQNIAGDYSGWAAGFIDAVDFSARHAEYVAIGHYLNGVLDGGLRLQGAIRELCRQGFCRLPQNQGKIQLRNYITDAATTLSTVTDDDFIFQKSKSWGTTDTKTLIQKIVCNFDKNHSTGKLDGQYIAATGATIENFDQIDLDLVGSSVVAQTVMDWLFSFRSTQLNLFNYDGNFKCLSFEKSDIVQLSNFLNENTGENMRILSASMSYGQGKNNKMPKIKLKCLREGNS